MGDFQQVLQVIPPPPVINYPTHPRVIVVPPLPPVITYSTLNAPVVPTFAVERTTSVNIPAMPAAGSAPLSINALTPLSTFGLINPLLTMQTKDQPYFIPFSYLSSLQKQDPLTVSTLNAQTVNAVSSFVGTSYTVSSFNQNVLTDYIEATEAYVYDKLTLDNQVLTANSTELLLNGNPIVTANQISSIADWAKDPAISTIQANNNDLIDVRQGFFSSITANSMTVNKLTTLFSTTVETFESTFVSETQKLTVSSITGGNGFFDVLTANSIINPSASTINCQYLNVSSNANMLNATFSNAPTFNQGGTFNGTRPNFNTGINTSGANNFNFTNIDNASNINGNVITIAPSNNLNINTSNAVATVVDRGADVGGSAVIGLTARFGAGSQINLNANSASVFSPTPASAINLDAQGNVSYLSGIPFGGAINLTARAGLSGSGTSVAGGGGINLTAFSYGGLAPGTIKESAGSILSYSGLTVPSVGVLGSGFYSALNCLSLTAGASPATTSFPGVVYLRGDNGTKVVNGFYSDTIDATGNSTLPTITTNALTAPVGSNLAFFATSQNIQFNSATVGFNANIAGDFSVSTITNVSTINGSAYPPTFSVPNALNVSSITASTITSPLASLSSIVNVSSINGTVYPPPSGVPSNLVVSTMTVSSLTTTTSLTATSTIQGLSYLGNTKSMQWSQSATPGGQNWSAVSGGINSGIYYSCVNGGFIYYSSNGGVSWTKQATLQAWTGIATGKTAGTAIACVAGGGIYYTTNSGTTWTLSASAPTANWSAVCGDPYFTGSLFNACVNGGGVYKSTDSGATWALVPGSINANWTAMCSASQVVFITNTNLVRGVYFQNGSGGTLTASPLSPSGNFNSILATTVNSVYTLFVGRNDGFTYYTNGVTDPTSNFTWFLTTVKGYVGGSGQGYTVVACLPNNPIQVSYDFCRNWYVTNSPSLPWSCVTAPNLPILAFLGNQNYNNPCIVGTNTGYLWSDVGFNNLPITTITGHELTLQSDTGEINLNSANLKLDAAFRFDLTAQGAITFTCANGFINMNGFTRFLNTQTCYLPKNTQMASPSGSDVRQPFIQYGLATTGTTSPYTVTLPQAYTNTSYVVQISHRDTSPLLVYSTSNLTTNTFNIYWSGGGAVSQTFNWTTFGI